MERSAIVRVKEGLHARPAARFVKLAKAFQSDVEIAKGGKTVSAKSSVKLMLLTVKEGDEVTLKVCGPDENEAMGMLLAYLENPQAGLGDEPEQQQPSTEGTAVAGEASHQPGGYKGAAASAGVALGPVFPYFPPTLEPADTDIPPAEREAEKARLRKAVAAVTGRMETIIAAAAPGSADAEIVKALIELANDEDLIARAEETIGRGLDAVSATLAAGEALAVEFEGLDDPYMKARAEDLHAVTRQICLALTEKEDVDLSGVPDGAILVAEDIGAFELARAPLSRIAGILCGHGGATSHVAIIARNHGIPAVMGLGSTIEVFRTAGWAALDGGHGLAFADPDETLERDLTARIARQEEERKALTAYVDHKLVLADGRAITIAANLGALSEIDNARAAGAMGVGLFRTELMFMAHPMLPSEEEQYETYAALATAFAPEDVIVRTLDIGGDKPVTGIDFPDEENPFLGWRGIRMCLDRPAIFKPQLRALLRANREGNLKVMLPMVSTLDELRRTRTLIEACEAELEREGKAFRRFALGVMIETPAAVLIAPELAAESAFFSIGTNDLTQYIMAADRLNMSVAGLGNVSNPAVMRAIELTTKAGVEAGIMVGICGEAAADTVLIPRFLKMGISELSMSPASVLAAKKAVAEYAAKG
ncbi:phosphoenolpyruvate--protein phosphotransferase [Chelativorans salis]|uniref:Phosphoenolpyruvate-protein phosphotransferase n=1 Tax=Chelativorans salis TaxID=2978478 RepID=A0ABT2LJ47_9HYPH|nr:phosphoenolpyruvate--protein phosphotransferase [Chelativorans sp. EGI FJ00035]MCT7374513.1 phosphoenolpyruvate--protein phosphotransferase [Chelativorans sp. EGI FJ00035]